MTEAQAPYTTRLSPLTQATVTLARARLEAEAALTMLAAKQEWFREEYGALFAAAEATTDRVSNAERVVRVMAEEGYDGDKHPGPGVNIRMERVLPDYLPEHALAWCKQHDVGITFDKRVFERVALAGGVALEDHIGNRLPLQPQELPKATIAKDLPAALRAAGVPFEEATEPG